MFLNEAIALDAIFETGFNRTTAFEPLRRRSTPLASGRVFLYLLLSVNGYESE